jgi:hypothetical protein
LWVEKTPLLPEYRMTPPSPSSVFMKTPIQDMLKFVCDYNTSHFSGIFLRRKLSYIQVNTIIVVFQKSYFPTAIIHRINIWQLTFRMESRLSIVSILKRSSGTLLTCIKNKSFQKYRNDSLLDNKHNQKKVHNFRLRKK